MPAGKVFMVTMRKHSIGRTPSRAAVWLQRSARCSLPPGGWNMGLFAEVLLVNTNALKIPKRHVERVIMF